MPFLTAKALDLDPDGMAFLRSVVRPDFEREPATPLPRKDWQAPEPASPGRAETLNIPVRPQAEAAAPVD